MSGLPSPHVTEEMAKEFLLLYFKKGWHQHEIAAKFGVNQGRVSEVVNGKRYPNLRKPKLPSSH